MTRILTERLILETLSRDEAAAIRDRDRSGRAWAYDYPSESDRVVAAIVGEAGDYYSEADTWGPLQIRLAQSGLAIGGVGMLSAPDGDGSAEIGYGLVESARGQGHGGEAVVAVIRWAGSQGLRSIVAMTSPDNVASQRLLIRNGFARAGVIDGGDDGTLVRWVLTLEQ
ncbi:unannotated protein [freshwater metagenome]|uniref:Unannotated protein n=1 Tax=freshwater metagenome TaxID=449393 RepID=A0A6J7JZK8_9ZZZZ|nr:GNAT family N-acetyltransferase [Actinomycetota bacterium]MSW37112.1 GNAT family N-acetyltransferase [Actinomycetota bacterium]MSX38806.1 GNAT family N-acetyltransferase [Actinomycetota bacterium]